VGAVRSGLGFLSWVGAAVIVIALVLKFVWFDVATVGHNGMAPTLVRGERVLIHKRGQPELGAIAVCRHPSEDGWVVGRVAATGGMTIQSFGSELRIDGELAELQPKGTTTFANLDTDRTRSLVWAIEHLGEKAHLVFMEENGRHLVRKTQVPEGKLFLLGDFRAYMGQDSRAYGVVNAATCRGTIVFRLTPAGDLPQELQHGYFEPIR
jgi:signal peptidase I